MWDLLAEYRDVRHPRNVGLISLSHGVNEFYTIVLPPVLPLLVTDFGITYAQAGLLLTVFFLMYSVFQLPAGLVADRFGKKRVLVLGLAGMAASLVLAGAAGSYEALLVAQALAGISGSTYHPTGMSLVSDLESGETEGKAMGVFGFGGMLGVATAPLAVGGVAALLGWRAALVAAAVGGFGFVVVFYVLFREPGRTGREAPAPEPDGGADEAPRTGGRLARARGRLAGVLRFRITPPVAVLALLTLLISLQLRALHTFATAFVVDGVGRSTALANGLFFTMLAASAVASIWVGGLADRFDRRLLGAAAAGVTTLILGGTFLLAAGDGLAGGLQTTALLVGAFALLGFAVYGCSPVKNALISEYATESSSGGLFGVTQTTSAAGSAVGPALFGAVATDAGVAVAFPLVATVSLLIAAGFLLLARVG
ncbi:MAG: MFS transporter [Haloferacaceae archaeon]